MGTRARDGGPAYPVQMGPTGMSLREAAALKAMQALARTPLFAEAAERDCTGSLEDAEPGFDWKHLLVELSFDLAEEFLAEKERRDAADGDR